MVVSDNDRNGIMDYLSGFSVNVTSTPESSYLIQEGDTFISYEVDLKGLSTSGKFKSLAVSSGKIFLIQSQIEQLSGTNTNTLKVKGIRFDDMQVDNVLLNLDL